MEKTNIHKEQLIGNRVASKKGCGQYMEQKEIVHIISDSVGETAEFVVKAVAAQFNGGYIEIRRHPHVEEVEDIDPVIEAAKRQNAIIAYTLVVTSLKDYLDRRADEEGVIAVDLMNPLMEAFMKKFHKEPYHRPKLMRKLDEEYFKKIEAIEFAVKYDDGRDATGLKKADIVLLGVSRTSKTPLSMYLAHHSFKVANVPIVPEIDPPEELFTIPREKCVGLMIAPEKLNEIRKERIRAMGLKSDVNYASYDRIYEELAYAEKIMRKIRCPIIDVSNKAVEETASLIIEMFKNREELLK